MKKVLVKSPPKEAMIEYSDCTHNPENKNHYKTIDHSCIFTYIMKLNSLRHYLALISWLCELSLTGEPGGRVLLYDESEKFRTWLVFLIVLGFVSSNITEMSCSFEK